MIPFTIALAIFAGLSFVHAEIGPNIAELKQTVVANDLALEKAIKEYEALKFYNISELAKTQLTSYWKNLISKFMEIPTILPVDDLSDDQYKTYQLMIIHSKYSLIYSNPGQISDILKIDALYTAIIKNTSYSGYDRGYLIPDELPLTPIEIVDRVLKVIHEEDGVLVNGRFEKPNSELNYLYEELSRIKIGFPSSSYFHSNAEELYEKCALPSTGCGIELRGAIHNRMVLKEKTENCLPIDSKLKVDKLLAILADCRNADNEMFDALKAANFDCLLSWTKDACNKRSEQ